MIKRLISAGFACVAGLAVSAPAVADISIATSGPMTGQFAAFGAQMKAGAEQAVADINAAGGINGEKLVLEVGDDACDTKQAVAVANQMVGKGVVFVAGHLCSSSSIAASAVYAEQGIVQISPASANPKFTDERPGPGIFRVYGRSDQQGKTAGAYLASAFQDRNIAILHDKTAYGKGLADATKAAMNAAGKVETLYEAYNAGEKDYAALVSKLRADDVGVVYVGGYHTEAGLIKRQMADQGMDAILVSGDALATDEYWSITGPAGEGTLMTFPPDPRKTPEAAPVVTALEAAGKPAEGFTLYTYAAIQAWAEAAKAAGTTDFDGVVEALDSGEVDTVLGTLSFDDKGDVSLPAYVWYVWHDGKYGYK